jgi:hypothetical protein
MLFEQWMLDYGRGGLGSEPVKLKELLIFWLWSDCEKRTLKHCGVLKIADNMISIWWIRYWSVSKNVVKTVNKCSRHMDGDRI